MNTAEAFCELTAKLGKEKSTFVLAELNDLLTAASADAFASLTIPSIPDAYLANYVAAMVELDGPQTRRSSAGVDFGHRASFRPRVCRPVAKSQSTSAYRIAHSLSTQEYLHQFQYRRESLMLTAPQIMGLFQSLNHELAQRAVRGEVYLVGGAVMCLAF